MIELSTIDITDESSVFEARNKVLVLAENCSFGVISSVRLATITSEICRAPQRKESPAKLTIGLSEKDNRYGLLLSMVSNEEHFSNAKLNAFFDQVTNSQGKTGEQQVDAFRYIVDAAFSPDEDFIASTREKLIQQSAAELFEELEKKNKELSGLLDERKVVVQELRKKTVALEAATRLKSEFLANMSHELRTPLNSIIGFTTRVIKKTGEQLPERQLKNLHTVARNAQHLLSLINSLLDISKIEAGKMDIYPEKFEIGSLVDEVLELTQALVGKKELSLLNSLPQSEITLYSDRSKLKQILINLVSNSIKFTETGNVTVSATRVEPDFSSKENFFQPTIDYIKITVTDTGIGLDDEEKQIIFEAFRQVDGSLTRKEGGTGLGLAITQKFSELLQGRIEVESSKGEGTTFTVTLPMTLSKGTVDNGNNTGR